MSTQGTVIERVAVGHEAASAATPVPPIPPASPGRAPLPRRIGRSLLFLAPLTGDAGLVSFAALTHEFSCDSTLCSTATLGHHPGIVLVLSGVYLLALSLLVVATHRFAEVAWPHLATAGALVVIGTVAAAGVLVIVFTAFAVLATGLAFLSLFLLATGRFRPTTPNR
jgi:hypothetical protein